MKAYRAAALSGYLLVAVLGVACAGPARGVAPTPPPPVAATRPPGATLPSLQRTPAAGTTAGESGPVVALAIADAVSQAGISTDQVKVQSVEARTWPDSALGCPKPGQSYLQVLTPGFQITLRVKDQAWEYHSDRDSVVVRC